MQISLAEVAAFSSCPAYFKFLGTVEPIPLHSRTSIVISTIKAAYLQAMQTGFRATWKRIVGWVDSVVFKDVNMSSEESYKAARLLSEHILSALNTWYYNMYMNEDVHSYIDIDLGIELGEHKVLDTIDVIQLANPVCITVFTEIGMDLIRMYNDFVIRGRGWLTARNLESREVSVRVLGIGPRGGMTSETFLLDQVVNDRFERNLTQIVASIGQGIDYPSRSGACDSCPFLRRCRL